MTADLARLRRVRWAVRGTLALGVAASVAANILHAEPTPIAQTIAAWPPLALLLTVELISRVPVHRRGLAALRLVATGIIAGIAAWVSYTHMVGVVARYESGATPWLLPLSVDGLVVVASVCLVELAGWIRDLETAEPTAAVVPPADPVPAQVTTPDAAPVLPEPDGPAAEVSPARAKAGKVAASAPKRPFALTQQAAASMDAGGLTVPQIAAALGIGERQVRNALRPVPVTASAVGSDDG